MSKPAFGKLLDPDLNPTRDAIHIPIIPVFASCSMWPGDPITIKRQKAQLTAFRAVDMLNAVGVVDPYLETLVTEGQLFYCFVKPETVQKLWHEWKHKEIDRNYNVGSTN